MLKNTRTSDNSTGLWSSMNRKTIKVCQKRDVSVWTGNNLAKIVFTYKVFRIIKASYKLQGFFYPYNWFHSLWLVSTCYRQSISLLLSRHFNSHLIRLRHYTHKILFNAFQFSIFSNGYSCSIWITCLRTINKISNFNVIRKKYTTVD